MSDAIRRSLDAIVRIATPSHAEAMGIRLISGRDFSWQHSSNSEPIMIINETAARRHWPGESPIGRFGRGMGKNPSRVVAVASFAASKGIASLLFKTEPTDHNTFLAVLILLLAVAGLAGYLPALRATRIDPMTALRCE